jgi:hypothetical protein
MNKRRDPFRSNFKEFGFGFRAPTEVTEFGCKQEFGALRKWPGRHA